MLGAIEKIYNYFLKYSLAAICLQETLLKPDQTQTFKHYSAYSKSGNYGQGGVCILVRNNFIHNQVQFQADLQAAAVCITISNKTYTVTVMLWVGLCWNSTDTNSK